MVFCFCGVCSLVDEIDRRMIMEGFVCYIIEFRFLFEGYRNMIFFLIIIIFYYVLDIILFVGNIVVNEKMFML